MGKEVWSKVYRTWVCSWCRRHLADGEKLYFVPSMEEFHFCEDCKHLIQNTPDFDERGAKEKGTTSWRTAHNLTLYRDDCHCRVCGDHYHRENPVDVHHIIPQKDGGIHNLKNLITLCERHHIETFANDYAGLKIIDRQVQNGTQKILRLT